nr:MAG TPA: hypothetical protein [Caudoviricetes sp.]
MLRQTLNVSSRLSKILTLTPRWGCRGHWHSGSFHSKLRKRSWKIVKPRTDPGISSGKLLNST